MNAPEPISECLWKYIWRVKIQYKVVCFTWLLANEAVLTHENVIQRGISLCSWCSLCGDDAETVGHLFLYANHKQLLKIFINLKGIL